MEQIVVSGSRTEGMGWFAAFPAELIQSQINKVFIWKYGKYEIAHDTLLLGKRNKIIIIYQNATLFGNRKV